MSLERKLRRARDSICGLLRIRRVPPNQFTLTIVGTTWCFVRNKYFLTAHHVLNDGQPRHADDQFLILRAPENGTKLERMLVAGFTHEDPQHDVAILEIGDPSAQGITVPALTISFDCVPDGTSVLTYGYPAPQVTSASLTEGQLNFQTVLVATANRGIVSAQFPPKEAPVYVFNIHWFNGESGGPILRERTLAAFAVMQGYVNVQAPHGIIAGPRMGRSLAAIRDRVVPLLPRRA